MRKTTTFLCSSMLCVLLSAAIAVAGGKYNKKLSIGDKAPDFTGLVGTDDKPHALSDYGDAKAVLLVFTCNHCPVAVANEDRLIELQRDYKDKGVRIVAINCNNNEADKLPAMKERALAKEFNFDYVYDPSQDSGRAYGATVTPHVFLLDGDHKVAYMGAIDDSPNNPSRVKTKYVRDAIEAVLGGRTPDVQETQQQGCGIKYE